MKRQNGFSMLEVLIAMLIIMLGVLGIAGMQLLAMNNTENGRYGTQAAILASSLGAAMQANPGFWATSGVTPATVTVAGTTITGVPTGNSCLNTNCPAANMAYDDLYHFGAAMSGNADLEGKTYNATALPGGAATINCNVLAANSSICQLQLTWNETTTVLSNNAGMTGSVASHDYYTIVSIQP
jgi:type IV pilus assembly protein PilV